MHTGVPFSLGEALAVGVSQPCPGGSAGTAGKMAPNWFIWVRVAEKAAIPLKDGFSPFGWNQEHDSGILCGLILCSLKGKETQESILFLKAVKSESLKRNVGNEEFCTHISF